MNPWLLRLIPIAWAVLRVVGQSLLGILTTLLAGRTLRRLVYWPVEWISRRTRNRVDDQVADDIASDLGLPAEHREEREE